MKLLVLGASGNLGSALAAELTGAHQPILRRHDDYDLRDLAALARDLRREKPDAVINCAGYTRVDDAEGEAETAMAVNGEAPGKLAGLCREAGVVFVQPGTDYIFDGKKAAPYLESDAPNPLNVYGRTKLAGERAVIAAHPEGHLILRTSWLFGAGRNFVRGLLMRYRAGEREFRVVGDQRGRPTYAPDLARALRVALEKGARGIYHAGNAGEASWQEFALEIFAAAGLGREVSVRSVTSAEFPARARRPLYSVLDTGKLAREQGVELPDYRDALSRYLKTEGLKT